MGSHLLQGMPRTGRYKQLIAMLGDSAGGNAADAPAPSPGTLAQIADATLDASIDGLELARSDEGLAYCIYLMFRVTRAARQQAFLLALEQVGVPTPATISGLPDVPIITDPAEYTVYDLTSGFTAAVDRHLRSVRARTDVGELAELGAAETLSVACTGKSNTLFDLSPSPPSVQASLLPLSTGAGFGRLAHDYFARFIRRFLDYHLSRELSNHVGGSRRFRDVDTHNDFLRQLGEHCHSATGIMRGFATGWYAKRTRLREITLEQAKGFAAHALGLVRESLAYQEGRDV